MLIKRIITAFFLVAGLASALMWSSLLVFQWIILGVTFLTLIEYFRLAFSYNRIYRITGLLAGMVMAMGMIWPLLFKIHIVAVVIGLLFVVCLVHMMVTTVVEGCVERIGYTFVGIVYLGMTLPYFAHLFRLGNGRTLIVMTIVITAMGDTAAMLVGKKWGKRKLAPLISPNKTVEGFIASFAGGILGMLICRALMWPTFPLKHAIILGLSVALIGALGDLIESLIKRHFHVKDSGNVLPGHGGVLDRADALVFSAPFVFYYVQLIGVA